MTLCTDQGIARSSLGHSAAAREPQQRVQKRAKPEAYGRACRQPRIRIILLILMSLGAEDAPITLSEPSVDMVYETSMTKT